MVHRTLSGAQAGSAVKSLLSGTGGGDVAINHLTVRWYTGLSGEPSVPELNAQQRTHHSQEFAEDAVAKIHRTVRCVPDCPVSQRRPRPTVGSAINGQHVARANGHLVAPDCPVCTRQCPMRQGYRWLNGRLSQKRKEIGHRTCTGLSGAPLDRRQELPSK